MPTDLEMLGMINTLKGMAHLPLSDHARLSDHLSKEKATKRTERPCGYFLKNVTEKQFVRTVRTPKPLNKQQRAKQKKAEAAGRTYTPDVGFDEVHEYRDIAKVRVDVSGEMTAILKGFFKQGEDLARVSSGTDEKPMAEISGNIVAPYAGMTDAGGRSGYESTDNMKVILGGGGGTGSNLVVVTAFPF